MEILDRYANRESKEAFELRQKNAEKITKGIVNHTVKRIRKYKEMFEKYVRVCDNKKCSDKCKKCNGTGLLPVDVTDKELVALPKEDQEIIITIKALYANKKA